MKKIHFLLTVLFALPLVVFTSCLKDENDTFGESAANRLQETLTNTRKILMGAENGWVMDYYVGTDQENGGKVVIVKFDSLECTAMSEYTDTLASTSFYKLTSDNGPVLTFDTYNEVLHMLATPSASSYEGKHADFEMTVMSATPEKVVLKGKKTNNYIYLYPLKGSATDYLAKVTAMSDSMIVGAAEGTTADGKKISGKFDVGNRSVTFTSTTDTTFHKSTSFIFTDTGVRFYEDVDFGNGATSGMVYDGGNNTLTASGLTLNCSKPDGWTPFADFAGLYDLYCYDGENEASLRVKLTPGDDGESYLLSGVSDNYDIKLDYKKGQGLLSISPQKIATVGSNDVYVCILDNQGSYLSWSSDVGLYIKSAGSDKPGVFNITSNDYEDFTSGSIIVWVFQDGESLGGSEVRSWLSSHTQYLFTTGGYYLPKMISLSKVEE